ncbi:carbon monoxide dehydrogenase subunit G [Ferrovibrio sp. MS7]|uniref:SRPBCC family protein n=1 Tax=Ferrovibrio plantarum TaxID=3119164 RepID=UPI001B49D92B|nr:carbon monoxide dehydrogenase subunit G [Ferrovibrio sp.]
MEMTGEQLIPAPRAAVWEALNDPAILKQCIPGCDTLEKTSDTSFEAAVTVKLGPVKAKFKGKVALSDIDPPNGYTISGEAQGGVAAGFGKGSAKVSLSDADGGTRLAYAVNAQVGGKLAQIGARLIDATAAKMADDFFSSFNTLVAAGNPAAASMPGPAAAAAPAAEAAAATKPLVAPEIADQQPEPEGSGLPAWAWIGGLIVLVGFITALVLKF